MNCHPPASANPTAYELTATEGAPPYSWSIDGPSLPAGLGLEGTGRISGIPTTPVRVNSP